MYPVVQRHGNLVFAFVTWASLCSATYGEPTKKLIHFGIDTPDTATMRQHIAEMEQAPFDGWVFYAAPTTDPAKRGDFGWKTWGARVFTKAQMQRAVEDLQSTPFKKFTRNFMHINTTPGDVDWFDSFDHILNNMRVAA